MSKPEPVRTIQRIFASLLIIAAITAFYFFIFKQANSTTIALTFLLVTLGIAAGWGLLEAIIASVVGVLCFNIFFLPPLFTFYLADTQNWVALSAFLEPGSVRRPSRPGHAPALRLPGLRSTRTGGKDHDSTTGADGPLLRGAMKPERSFWPPAARALTRSSQSRLSVCSLAASPCAAISG